VEHRQELGLPLLVGGGEDPDDAPSASSPWRG
jgi:hypothetical protein